MPRQRFDNLGAVGLNTDLLPSSLPPQALTYMFNTAVQDNTVRNVVGERKLFDLAVRPLYHTTWQDPKGIQFIVVCNGLNTWLYDTDGNGSDISPQDINSIPIVWSGGQVSFANLNGVLIVNSDTNGPFYYDQAANRLIHLPGPGDATTNWLFGFGVPDPGTGLDDDYYQDTDTGDWYKKSGGSWAITTDVITRGWDHRNWRCKVMAAYKYYLVALHMTEYGATVPVIYPHKIRWSTFAPEEGSLPIEWEPLVSNEAGSDVLGDTEGELVGATLVRDSLYLVKTDALYSLDHVQGQYILSPTRLKGGIGSRLYRGFSEMKGGMVLVTTSDVLLFDGTRNVSLAEKRIRDSIFQGTSEEYWDLSQIFVHWPSRRMFFARAAAGSIGQLTEALIYNWEEDNWSRRSIGRSYGYDSAFISLSTEQTSWDNLGDTDHVTCEFDPVTGVCTTCWDNSQGPPQSTPCGVIPPHEPVSTGDEINPAWIVGEPWDNQTDGSWNKGVYQPSVEDILVYETNDEDTAWWVSLVALSVTDSDGSVKTCTAERTGLPIEGGDRLAMVTEVWPEIRGDIGTVLMWVGGQETIDDMVKWDGPYPVDPNTQAEITPRLTGRFLAWRIQSESIGSWRFGAMTISWEEAGER